MLVVKRMRGLLPAPLSLEHVPLEGEPGEEHEQQDEAVEPEVWVDVPDRAVGWDELDEVPRGRIVWGEDTYSSKADKSSKKC